MGVKTPSARRYVARSSGANDSIFAQIGSSASMVTFVVSSTMSSSKRSSSHRNSASSYWFLRIALNE